MIAGLLRPVNQDFMQLDFRFRANRLQEAEVAAAFLDEAKCRGAHGLSEENKARLQEIRDRGLPASPKP